MEIVMIKNNSERDFRWPELEICAGDTVEIYKEQMDRIPVLQKLLKAGELEIVGAKGEPEKVDSHKHSEKPEEAQEKAISDEEEDAEKEAKEILKNIKGKKK